MSATKKTKARRSKPTGDVAQVSESNASAPARDVSTQLAADLDAVYAELEATVGPHCEDRLSLATLAMQAATANSADSAVPNILRAVLAQLEVLHHVDLVALGDLVEDPFSTFIFDLQARVTLALQISERQERLRRRASKQCEGAVTP